MSEHIFNASSGGWRQCVRILAGLLNADLVVSEACWRVEAEDKHEACPLEHNHLVTLVFSAHICLRTEQKIFSTKCYWIRLVSCLEFYVLTTAKVRSRWIPTYNSVHSLCCPTGKSGCQHHAPISHLVTLSWHWASKSLPYPINGECHAWKQQVWIWQAIGLIWPETELPTSRMRVLRSTNSETRHSMQYECY